MSVKNTREDPIFTPELMERLVKRCEEPRIDIPHGLIRNRDEFHAWLKKQCKD